MEKPNIVSKEPMVVKLNLGIYYACRCGLSKKQPFCDGAHEGTKFSPEQLVVGAPLTVVFCLCKQSLKGSVCDGTHSKL